MSKLSAQLERTFGASAVSAAKPRFDAFELPMITPPNVQAAVEVMRFCASERLSLLPIGLGSKLGWCKATQRADLLLSTRALTGIVAHEPGDGTLTAQAGMTMSDLRERAARGGHWLTPDVPHPRECTLGGVLAAGQSAADRLRFGPVRHHVLGMKVLLADGSIAKTGGQLVKNVTGYDLHRLYTGSHGTLCVILEASLRLFPLPERELWITTGASSGAEMLALAAAALALPIRIVSLTAARLDPAPAGLEWALFARLGGKRDPVDAELAELARVWPTRHVEEDLGARDDACALRDQTFVAADGPSLHIACRPSALVGVLSALDAAVSVDGFAPRWMVEPGIAYADIALRPSADAVERIAPLVRHLRAELAPLGARISLRHAPSECLADLDPFGDPPPGVELMRRIRGQLDPHARFDARAFAGSA